eukprot:g2369.t1
MLQIMLRLYSAAQTCEECVSESSKCGWSPTRKGCYPAHPFATTFVCDVDFTVLTEEELDLLTDKGEDLDAETWYDLAMKYMDPFVRNDQGQIQMRKSSPYSFFTEEKDGSIWRSEEGIVRQDYGIHSLHQAYICLTNALEKDPKHFRAHAARQELAPKFAAVFDEDDARELLRQTQYPKLLSMFEKQGRAIEMIPRRSVSEAKEFIRKNKPVVITGLYDTFSNIWGRWTLDYFSKSFSTLPVEKQAPFTTALERAGSCCRYIYSEQRHEALGYPHPYEMETTEYHDSMTQFIETLRLPLSDEGKLNLQQRQSIHPLYHGDSLFAENAAKMKQSDFISNEPQIELSEMCMANSENSRGAMHYLHHGLTKEMNPWINGVAANIIRDNVEDTRRLARKKISNPLTESKIWIGEKGTYMRMHQDGSPNYFIQVYGRKKAYLADTDQRPNLYLYPTGHPAEHITRVAFSDPDVESFPKFANVVLQEVVIGPGDVLYLPRSYFHQFEQPFENSMSINQWSKPDDSFVKMPPSLRKGIMWDEMENHLYRLGADTHLICLQLSRELSKLVDALMPETKFQKAKVVKRLNDMNPKFRAILQILRKTLFLEKKANEKAPAHARDPAFEGHLFDLLQEFLEPERWSFMEKDAWKEWKPGMKWKKSSLMIVPPWLEAIPREHLFVENISYENRSGQEKSGLKTFIGMKDRSTSGYNGLKCRS